MNSLNDECPRCSRIGQGPLCKEHRVEATEDGDPAMERVPVYTPCSNRLDDCPACHGYGSLLGILGRLYWFRCQDCGLDFSFDALRRTAKPERTPECELD